MLNTAGALAGILILVVAVWQLDHLAAPYVWVDSHMREIAKFGPNAAWFMLSTDFYCLCVLAIFLGVAIALVSLWFWED